MFDIKYKRRETNTNIAYLSFLSPVVDATVQRVGEEDSK